MVVELWSKERFEQEWKRAIEKPAVLHLLESGDPSTWKPGQKIGMKVGPSVAIFEVVGDK